MSEKKQRKKMISEAEAIALVQKMIDETADEMKRLREVEENYKNLLTLVECVAFHSDLAMDDRLHIKITKKAQMKSTSWFDLLKTHFESAERRRKMVHGKLITL